ncbi:MAG: TauD/TfdA family dioxygenase [Proteobacteria bacterium]|nr:TauD/TfdA family dioxygenase [Pseudomonadota bacterium]
MPITVEQLHPLFAASVSGLDLRNPPNSETVDAIRAAIDRYAVLVFHGQSIDDQQQLAFGRLFGPLETATLRMLKERNPSLRHPEMNYVSNLNEEGHRLPADNRIRMYQLANRLWHTDSSFKKIPGRYSLLHARVVPPVGGETEFADLRAAYDALPEKTRSKIAGLSAEHSLLHSNAQLGLPDVSDEERAALAGAEQPVVRIHPTTKRMSLYLASHASHIVGWPVPEGRLLLLDLIEFATQRSFVYRHSWRQGDLAMWDNRCTMHRVLHYDDVRFRRDLRRVMVQDMGAPGPDVTMDVRDLVHP